MKSCLHIFAGILKLYLKFEVKGFCVISGKTIPEKIIKSIWNHGKYLVDLKMIKTKDHWENVYSSKLPEEVSWTQEIPKTSLEFIHSANLDKSARIIDIGGGDSKLVDFLLEEGFDNITVLDISEAALKRAKQRLGANASKVHWVVSDITDFKPATHYDFWHDRATFHFLTSETQIQKYIAIAKTALHDNGFAAIGTFSMEGPEKCSGLEIKQYSEDALTAILKDGFEKVKCITENHITPFNTIQNFLFCSFIRMEK